MKIEAVDFFYLAMSEITTDADGSQDALLVRVAAGGYTGFGECEASPLTSIAAFVAPMSHGMCRPVGASVLGQKLEAPGDIARIAALVERDSMDLLQAAHTWSGVEMALWDLLGKLRGDAVWRLLGNERAYQKLPYASLLFGGEPQETFERARDAVRQGFRAAKFGWAGFGEGALTRDADHLAAAREGLGPEGTLLIDVGQVFGDDVERAALRLPALAASGALWLEEPFLASALVAYGELARRSPEVRLAGGEGAHNFDMARNLIDYGGIGYVQIDCGRIGGIGPAKRVVDYAAARGGIYVNHTFTSHLALSASLQPYAGLAEHRICEYPAAPRALSVDMSVNHLKPDTNGEIVLPDAPGLGIEVNTGGLARYLIDVEIKVGGRTLYATPSL